MSSFTTPTINPRDYDTRSVVNIVTEEQNLSLRGTHLRKASKVAVKIAAFVEETRKNLALEQVGTILVSLTALQLEIACAEKDTPVLSKLLEPTRLKLETVQDRLTFKEQDEDPLLKTRWDLLRIQSLIGIYLPIPEVDETEACSTSARRMSSTGSVIALEDIQVSLEQG